MTQEDVSRGTPQCVHKDRWRPAQRNCLVCHAQNQREQRAEQTRRFGTALGLLQVAQQRVHSDICLSYRCVEECERMTAFLKEMGLK